MNPAVLSSESSILVTFLASFLIWFMLGGLVILWLIDGKVKREQALHAFLSCVLTWTVAMMIKSLFPTVRPFLLFGIEPLTLTVPNDSSFPSIHSAIAFAIATSVYIHNKKMGMKFVILALLVALGRVLSEVHFVKDVVFGALVGIATSYLIKKLHTFRLVS